MMRPLLRPGRPLRALKAARSYSVAAEPHAFVTPASKLLNRDMPGVSAIVLNRPEARNALSMQMVDELLEIMAKLPNDGTRVALLHANGPVFCAGADLRERKTMSMERVDKFLNDMNQMMRNLEKLPIPTVASVQGPAMGGGTELALCCDLRTGQRETIFALPEVKLGIIPGAGGTQRLTHLLGRSKAMELIFTGRKVGVEEALELGLVDKIAKEGQTSTEAAADLIELMLTSAPLSLRAAKQAINAAPGTPIDEGLRLERAAYATLLNSEDRLEGLRAFAEKRKPVFQGR